MRVLFHMPAPSYLRIYGSTIRVLADRGHQVLLSYDHPDKRRDPAADAIEAHERIEIVPRLPDGSRRFERAVVQLRVVTDYLRFLDPRFRDAPYLRRRLDKYLRGPARLLAGAPYGLPFAQTAMRTLLAVERRVPSDAGIEQAIAGHAPDAVVVSPLIGRTARSRAQTDTVKSALRLAIPVAQGVASWDHLTTKGVVKAVPDRIFVWNRFQAEDARILHGIPPDRIVLTGGQPFDPVFEYEPAESRTAFLQRLGFPADARYVLYAGSSPNIAPTEREVPFVRRWIAALRAVPELAGLRVLVRPHPDSTRSWADVDLAALGAEVAPRTPPPLPMSEADEAFYYDSIAFSEAVVGVNTTAMIVALALRKPVLTVRAPEFRAGQEGTLHFQRLLEASPGALHTAGSLDEHAAQLRDALADPDATRDAIDDFLRAFVRPYGLDVPGTAALADAIEALGGRSGGAEQQPLELARRV